MVRARAIDSLSESTQEMGSVRQVGEGVVGSEMCELLLKAKGRTDIACLKSCRRVAADDLHVEGSGIAVDVEGHFDLGRLTVETRGPDNKAELLTAFDRAGYAVRLQN